MTAIYVVPVVPDIYTVHLLQQFHSVEYDVKGSCKPIAETCGDFYETDYHAEISLLLVCGYIQISVIK